MLLNKMQRKPSSETLASLAFDSTLDSRMSSAEIPQMELLPVNYVHQCKEVRMPRPTTTTQQHRQSFMAVGMKYPSYKQTVTASSHSQLAGAKLSAANANKVQAGAAAANSQRPTASKGRTQRAQQPLPPPTIESWKFLQHQMPQMKPQQQPASASATHKYRAPLARAQSASAIATASAATATANDADSDDQDYAEVQSCCNSSCNSATQSSASSDDDDDASTVHYPDCEKSHSWNYRARISTCDVRRDIARAGVKSRADRIARIEQTDCDHQLQHNAASSVTGDSKRASLPAMLAGDDARKPEVVSQINRLFEHAKRPEQRRSTKQHRAPAPPAAIQSATSALIQPPSQPLCPASTPIKKEPNMRMHPREMLPCIEERSKRCSNSSAPGDCYDCVRESNTNSSEGQNSRCTIDEVRLSRGSPEQRQQVSRIPKPVCEAQQQQRHSTSSAQPYNEANEQLQRRIRQMFDHEEERKQQLHRQVTAEFRTHCEGAKIKLRATKSTAFEKSDKPKCNSETKPDSCDELDQRLLKQTRQPASASFQKHKMERIHIRKKRQPLLIINQLNESKPANNNKVTEEKESLNENKCNAAHKLGKESTHKSALDANRRTCGYKNCKYANCPMSAASNAGSSSASTPQQSDEEIKARKRLSLESCCSDSGVSSSTDLKERHTKENNMKNLEKCADCVKILLNQASVKPTVMQQSFKLSANAAAPKLKELDIDVVKEGQIKIHVGKASGGDPNDVQNFAKKSLTKATTDELLTAAAAKNNTSNKLGAVDKLSNRTGAASACNAANQTKQCNIENDLKNNEQRIYNNTNSNNSYKKKNCSNEHKPLCATTIKIDDDWVQEQNGCDTDSLMVPPPPPLRISSKFANARQYFHNNNNNSNHSKHSHSPGGDSDKHSVKIFVRSSTSSGGVDGNTTRASSISMCSHTSQTSGCSTNSDASALTNASKTSTSGSSYTTISSSASSSGCKCSCRRGRQDCTVPHKKDDENDGGSVGTKNCCSLDRMTKAGVFYNCAAGAGRCSQGTITDTLRACASSPTPSADNFSEISCIACGEEAESERDQKTSSYQESANNSADVSGPVNGVFWNNSYFQQDTELLKESVGKVQHKKGSELSAPNKADHSEPNSDDNEQCCCSLTSCDDDNCSYYEYGGSAGEPQTDDDHCVSRIEVHASVHTPSNCDGSNSCYGNDEGSSSGSSYKLAGNGKSGDCLRACECDKPLCCTANTNSNDKCTIEAERQRVRERERCTVRQQQQQEQQWLRQRMRERERQMQFIRNSSAEEVLIRNKHLLRKADLIHELRPRSMDGVIDSSSGSLNGDTTSSSPDSGSHLQNQQDAEARRIHRGHILTELLETERIYVNEMASILKGYRDQMLSEEMMHLVPASLQGKEDILFGNLHELYTFHNEIFLKDLENCISTTELVALCFVQRRDTFYRLYSFYCQNIPRSDRLRETLVDTHLFLQECQKRLGHKLPLGAYLLKPVQRITKYKLLLENLLGSSDSGSCTKELQKALDCMLIVLRCVNDSMHQVAITGFPSNLSQQGELLLQDPFQVWTESKKDLRLRKKPQQRHIFLYQKSMIFCKKTSKPGHNKSTYQFKHQLKMSQIGLTESVRGDLTRFEVWLQGRQEVHTLQALTDEVKNKWVTEIKRLLLNQLEELKGEKIKQYGMNHHGLRQTTSWDTPNILLGMPQRAVSCDASSESSNRNSNCSSSGDDAYPHGMPPLSAVTGNGHAHGHGNGGGGAGADKEQQEACGWSSDYSNSEDEMSIIEDNSAPGSKFVALADYAAMGHSEVSMRESDTVELLKVGCAGWWFVRVLEANAEGWTPAAYLEPLNRKSSRSSSRNQERINLSKYTE